MANTIKLKRSSTASDTPSAGDLEVGELAVNTADAKLFTKHTDNSIKEISGTGGGGGLSNVVEDTTPQLGGVLDTNGNNIEFGDSTGAEVNRLKFGAGDDLEIYHDGSNSVIRDAGTGNLVLRASEANFKNAAGTEFTAKFIQDGAAELYYDNAKKLETTADGVDIISTDDGNAIGPKLHLYRNSASPADFDDIGALYFTGNDSGGNRQDYAYISAKLNDDGDGSEDGLISVFSQVQGAAVQHLNCLSGRTSVYGQLYLAPSTIYSDPHIMFEGSTSNGFETTLNVTNPTADNTITLPDATGTVALQNQTINAQTGTTYTTVLSDAGKLVTLSNASAITLTIPPNSSVAYATGTRIDFIQIGAGQVTVAGGTGVTVNSTPTLKFRAQHSAASCIKIGTDTWQLVGDLAES